MITLAETVEITLGRVTLQSAEDHKLRNGYVTQFHAASQCLVHCFLIVHLTVAYLRLTLAITLSVAATLLDKFLGRDKLYACIDDIPAMNRFGIGMLTQQFQLWGKRADRCFHAVAI